jgi:hypothetical protein
VERWRPGATVADDRTGDQRRLTLHTRASAAR